MAAAATTLLPAVAAAAGLAGAVAALAGVALVARWRHRRALAAARAQLAHGVDCCWTAGPDLALSTLAAVRPGAAGEVAAAGRFAWQLLEPEATPPPALAAALAAQAPFRDVLLAGPAPAGAGPRRLLALSGGPVQGADGGLAGYAGTARELGPLVDACVREAVAAGVDRSEQLQALEARYAERSRQFDFVVKELDSFAHSVSHDLRAPLRVVDGFATILLEDYGGRLDDLGRDHLRRIAAAANRMNAMIDQLLALSRTTSRELERERVDLSRLAQELADELAAGDRSRAVRFEIAPGLVADGDRTLLRLVLQNLLSNAFKFTAHTPQAVVGFDSTPGERGPVYRVRDNGAGFDMRFADRLFGVFQRLHSQNEFPGTGVGLATVQRIVRSHGGRVWAESAPGAGATFHFTLWEGGPALSAGSN